MDIDRSDDISALLESLINCHQEDAYKVIVDLDILAETKPSLFREQFSWNDLGHILSLLGKLNGNAKTAGIRLAGKILHLVGPTEMIAKNADITSEMLLKGDEELKLFCLQQLAISAATTEGMTFLTKNMQEESHNSILELVVGSIGDDLVVAKNAAIVVKNIMLFPEGTAYFMSDTGMKLINNLLLKGAVVRFRVYELFVDILVKNEEFMLNNHMQGILNCLIQELQSDDILAQLNCLEMLSHVASSSSKGFSFITGSGMLEKLHEIFKNVEIDPMQQILLPGVIKFFGSTAVSMPAEILLKYPDFVQYIFDGVNSDDITVKVLCFETIANICSSEEGLKILYQNPEKLNRVMQNLGKVILYTVDEPLKVRLIDSLALMFTISKRNFGEESSRMREMLYQQIGQHPIDILMTCSKLPFPKIRCSALGALASIATHSWSEPDMALTAGFLEYLLDRRTEQEKEGRELKYQILKTLSQSMTSKENLGIEHYERVCKYVLEGPFYSEQQTAVEFERM